MPDSTKRPPVRVADDALDDDEAPISEPRPSSPMADPSILGTSAPSNDADAPLPPDAAPVAGSGTAIPVTPELTRAFLAKKATRDRIREVVEYRVPRGTQEADIENRIQDASVRAITTTALAQSVAGMRPWVSRIAQNIVIDYYRGNAKHLKWLNPAIDVQELPPDAAAEGEESEVPPEDPTAPPRPIEELDGRMLDGWLERNVKSKADRLTLEMIRYKAKTGKTNAEVAAEFGITEKAYDNRVLRFKAGWGPKRKKARRDMVRTIVLLLLAALVVAAALWWLLHRHKTLEAIGPTAVPVLRPAPTASASAGPEKFNQADPTEEDPQKPRPPQPGQ
jgi:DNA-directed RNA polymerase specialized sigma24 family protein